MVVTSPAPPVQPKVPAYAATAAMAEPQPQISGLEQKLAADQIHAQLSGVVGLAQPQPLAQAGPQLTPEQVLQRRQIADNVHAQLVGAAGSRRDERQAKRGHGKSLSRTNTNIRRSQKYMVRAVRDVRVAGLTGRVSPEAGKRAINSMVGTTTSYAGLLRPQLSLMSRVNEANGRIRQSAETEKSVVDGALGRLATSQERGEIESESYLNASGVRFDREEGRFEMAETRATLRDALSLVDEAVTGMRETLDAMQRDLTPREQGYQRKQLARMQSKYGAGEASLPAPEPIENRKNVRLGAEQVALATLEKERELLATDFREVVAMESYVA